MKVMVVVVRVAAACRRPRRRRDPRVGPGPRRAPREGRVRRLRRRELARRDRGAPALPYELRAARAGAHS